MVEDDVFSDKIDYVTSFQEILNLEGHQNRITGLRVTATFAEGVNFAYWWSFSVGGSAINGATPSSFCTNTPDGPGGTDQYGLPGQDFF